MTILTIKKLLYIGIADNTKSSINQFFKWNIRIFDMFLKQFNASFCKKLLQALTKC